MKLSLVHDMAEALVGDITPSSGISKEEKHKLELDAMQQIRSTLGSEVGDVLFELWSEYENASTKEAKLVKDFDKFEMIMQAYEYETAQNIPLDSFFETTKGRFNHPEVLQWVDTLYKKRGKAQGIFRASLQILSCHTTKRRLRRARHT